MKKAEREERWRKRLLALRSMEDGLHEEGFAMVAGVDEAGRGPLAGPVVAACVVLPPKADLPGVDDSKQMTARQRETAVPRIKEQALAYGLGVVSEKVIDEINILQATKKAMRAAVLDASAMLRETTGESLSIVLLDAVKLEDLPWPQRSLVHGDSRSLSIAAASVLAKVTRDAMMVQYDGQYPGYDFASNKGYGTKAHYAGLKAQGPCAIHRQSFLKKFFKKGR
ncbi:MAG: ribonuclease HII [Eubacteriales bacterium]|nr:ribonuclease HII [Eubacteriales bacterium]